MISFLKNFLANDKTPDEKALLSSMRKKDRDVLIVDPAQGEAMEEDTEEQACPPKGCGNCGCR